MATAKKIRATLHPVDGETVGKLAARRPVPRALADFWLAYGYGYFRGEDPAVSNRLLHPGDVLDIMDYPEEADTALLAAGLPFFETADQGMLAIRTDGAVIALSEAGQVRGIAPDFGEFVQRLAADPVFYREA